MARAVRGNEAQDSATLIAKHVEPHPYKGGQAEWRLKERSVPVWAIIGSLTANADNVDQVTDDYGISREAMDAALAYYEQHKALIDARLEMNNAF